MGDIEKQFSDGIDHINNILNKSQLEGLIELGRRLVSDVLPSQARYDNLTGNTVTSYAFGIYNNGRMIYFGTNNLKSPIRNKLRIGENFTGVSYDGVFKDFTANIDTDGGYGKDTSYQFLKDYRPNTREFAMVITTGTEYSQYLENKRHINVLTNSKAVLPDEFSKSFKPIQ